jgi:uncharacterized membrane protein
MVQLLKRISIFVLPLLFVTAGILHFLKTSLFVKIVPPGLPAPRLLVDVSGIAELTGGFGFLMPSMRRVAGWGLILLLVAVFPANVYMAADHVQVTQTPIPQWVLWARLPLQLVLIWWIWWAAMPHPRKFIHLSARNRI